MRRTIVVHTRLSGHMARDAAQHGSHGVQILTMGQLAGRLAGGFLQPIDGDELQNAVQDTLSAGSIGDLDAIKDLPGMVRATVTRWTRSGAPTSICRHRANRVLRRCTRSRLKPCIDCLS